MKMERIRARIQEIVTSEFNCEVEEVADEVPLNEIVIDIWDWQNLRDALEECFHVEVPDRILGVRIESPFDRSASIGGEGPVSTIGDLIAYIAEKYRRWLV